MKPKKTEKISTRLNARFAGWDKIPRAGQSSGMAFLKQLLLNYCGGFCSGFCE